jgi:hypothetical protein
MYRDGHAGLKPDPEKGAALLREAAEAGHGRAASVLAESLLAERSAFSKTRPDPAAAARYLDIAAKAGDLEAQTMLGSMYESGRGVATDRKRSLQLFESAADAGHVNALTWLGRKYMTGSGVERDEAKALEFWNKAAELGDADAMREIARVHEKGLAGNKADEQLALQWYRRATRVDGRYTTGDIQTRMLTPEDIARLQGKPVATTPLGSLDPEASAQRIKDQREADRQAKLDSYDRKVRNHRLQNLTRPDATREDVKDFLRSQQKVEDNEARRAR